jgi:hypothetical protein
MFTVKVSDPAGSTHVQDVRLLINSVVSGAQACYVYYDVKTKALLLVKDSGNGSTRVPLGSGKSLSNSQCVVLTHGAVAQTQGNVVSASIPIRFAPTFAGHKVVALYAEDTAGANSGLAIKGQYTVTK